MDADQDFVNHMREENRQLEELARIFRSQVGHTRNLQDWCMECIFKNSEFLLNSNDRHQFKCLPPILRRDFLKKLESWVKNKVDCKFRWSPQEFQQVYSLVLLLLDESIRSFDFGVFTQLFDKDGEMWTRLPVQCPKLTSISDRRSRDENCLDRETVDLVLLEDIMPFMLRLRKLKHISLERYMCRKEDLEQLVEAYPNLQTLVISFRHIGFDELNLLFKLKKLEVLIIGVSMEDGSIVQYVMNEVVHECVAHLPALRNVEVDDLHSSRHGVHNTRSEVGARTLALQKLQLSEGFNGWTANTVPDVIDLFLDGPIRNSGEFANLKKLKILRMCDINQTDMANILSGCGGGLEELAFATDLPEDISDLLVFDAFRIFHLCPNLKQIKWSAVAGPGRPDLYPVNESHFKNLKKFSLICFLGEFPSSLFAQILMAPLLEVFEIVGLNLKPEDTKVLAERLKRREILQHLRELNFTFDQPLTNQELVPFLKILPAYAPRLERLVCGSTVDEFLLQISNSQMERIVIPGFQFRKNIPFDLEG